MNTQSTFDPAFLTDDLVLRFVGGNKDGETISVSTARCMLGVASSSGDGSSGQDQCAIYRGPSGVVIQSHGADVLINDEPKSVHWLQVGDQIRLSRSQAVEVAQLGYVESELESLAPVFAEQPEVSDSVVENAGLVDNAELEQPAVEEPVGEESWAEAEVGVAELEPFADSVNDESAETEEVENSTSEEAGMEQLVCQYDEEPQNEQDPVETDEVEMNEQVDQRFESLESSVSQLHEQADHVNHRFDSLESSLSTLQETLESLALNGPNPVSTEGEALGLSVEPTAENTNDLLSTFEALNASFAAEETETETETETEAEAEAGEPEVANDATVEPEASVDESQADEGYDNIASLFKELAEMDETSESTVEPSNELSSEVSDGFVDPHSPVASDDDLYEEPVQEQLVEEPAAQEEYLADSVDQDQEVNFHEDLSSQAAAALEQYVQEDVVEEQVLREDDLANAFSQESDVEEAELAEPETEAAFAQEPALLEYVTEEPVAHEAALPEGNADETEVAPEPEVDPENAIADGVNDVSAIEAMISKAVQETEPTAELVAPATPVRTEACTESVADIFARLHGGTSESDDQNSGFTAANLRESVPTSFEEIEASISSTLNEDCSAKPSTESPLLEESIPEQAAPAQTSAFEAPAVAAEPPAPPAPPANDVASLMDKLRSSVAEEAEAETATEEANAAEAAGLRKKEDSVTDYMSMLMTRMNGESAESGEPVEEIVEAAAVVEEPAADVSAETPPVDEVMAEEEVMPLRKAAPIKSFDKMRELANSTSRSAIQRSVKAQQDERKKGLILQSLSLGSLALAVIMFWLEIATAGIAFSVIFAIAFGYVLYETLRPVDSQPQASKTPKPVAATPVATAEPEA